MSLLVYPVIRGIGWPVKRTPSWDTLTQSTSSGREVRLAYYTNPIWSFEITYGGGQAGGDGYILDNPLNLIPLATETDLAVIQGFYNQMQGRFGLFLYDDVQPGIAPGQGQWDSVAGQPIGTGDGTTTVFQLIRTSGGFTESIQAPFMLDGVSPPPNVYLNGVLQTYATDFSVDNTGRILFVTAPSAAVAIQ